MRNRRAWMILLRHRVVEYSVASINLRYRTGLALINAADLLAAIAPYASRVVVSTAFGIRIGPAPAAMSFCAPHPPWLWALLNIPPRLAA